MAKTQTASLDDLERQEKSLVFPRFSEATALEIGMSLVAAARRAAAPVVVDIRTPDRTLFHAALPGSTPDNDHWARRESNLTLRQHQSSLRAGLRLTAEGAVLCADRGLDPLHYSDHGGSFPVRVADVGVIGAITVSGLASEDDHAMIVTAITKYLGLRGV
jgi:uncharacterized protein (UPF0303 family)